MVAAVFSTEGWMGHIDFYFEGETASDLLTQYSEVQDLECLMRMSFTHGTKKDQANIISIDELVRKWYSGEVTMDDLEKFYVKLSIGSIEVTKVARNDAEVEALRKTKK